MKAVTCRQKNISNEVKFGLVYLEESLEVILSLRMTWLETERSLQEKKGQQEGGKDAGRNTDKANADRPKKRFLSSPVELNKGKRKKKVWDKEKVDEAKHLSETPVTTEPWSEVVSRKEKYRRKIAHGNKETPLMRRDETPESASMESKRASRTTKKQKKKRENKPRPDALMIRLTDGKSYAEVLGEIRKKVNPEDSETEVRGVRKTQSGGILLELGASSKGKEAFCETIKGIIGEKGKVLRLEPRSSVEIRDLECLSEAQEIEAALRRDIHEIGEVKIFVTKENTRGQKMAIVEMNESAARRVVKQGRIRVGWVICRVRKRVSVIRCYRCLGYGHRTTTCKGPDRSDICYRCGVAGHKAKDCPGPDSCVLCSENELDQERRAHVPGTRQCSVFKAALQSAKNKIR